MAVTSKHADWIKRATLDTISLMTGLHVRAKSFVLIGHKLTGTTFDSGCVDESCFSLGQGSRFYETVRVQYNLVSCGIQHEAVLFLNGGESPEQLALSVR